MKTVSIERNTKSNTTESKGFAIKAGAKAFQILRDGLYSRKEEAVCRETFTNAYDAHCMVGKKDVPFDITYPSIFDPTFRVRDFGPGMPHDFMMGDYTVAFSSTKDQTNDQVGGFGLGRMSAFSYTDQYSVTTWINGVKRFYSLSLDAIGVPVCHFLGESETDEPNGTEVSFPINNHDVDTFKRCVEKVVEFFDTKPTVKGKEHEWAEEEPALDGGFFKVYKGGLYGTGSSVARVGCVGYPINTGYYGLPRNFRFVVDFPVGSLVPSASREELSFGANEPTEENLKKGLKQVQAKLNQLAEERVAVAATLQDKVIAISSLGSLYRGSRATPDHFEYSFTYYYEKRYHRYNRTKFGPRASEKQRCIDPYRYISKGERVYVIDTAKKIVRVNDRITNNNPSGNVTYIKYDSTDKQQVEDLCHFVFNFPHNEYFNVEELPDPGPTKSTASPTKVKKICKYRTEAVTLSSEAFEKGGLYCKTLNNESILKDIYMNDLFAWRRSGGPLVYAVPKPLWKRFDEASQWKSLDDHLEELIEDKGDTYVRAGLYVYTSCYKLSFLSELKPSQSVTIGKADSEILQRVPSLRSRLNRAKECHDDKYQKVLVKYPLLEYYSATDHQHFIDYYNMMKGK